MNHREIVGKYVDRRGYRRCLDVTECSGNCVMCSEYGPGITGVRPSTSCKSLRDFLDGASDRVFDVIFLDSRHLCEDVLEDIDTALQHLSDGGVILIHDCLPKGVVMASRNRCRGEWCGDVFKAVAYYFSASRYLCYTLDIDYGVAVIDTKYVNSIKRPLSWDSVSSITYTDFVTHRDSILTLVPADSIDAAIEDPEKALSRDRGVKHVLFITGADGVDYQSDALFHGLVSSSVDVTDSKYLWYLSSIPYEKKNGLYGNGFSIAGKLSDRSFIDRSPDSIRDRISSHYYDCVVFGSIRRCSDFIDLVKEHYSQDEVVLVDGEDDTRLDTSVLGIGLYFKRELSPNDSGKARPISFAIPEDQFYFPARSKTRIFAAQVPGIKGRCRTLKEYRTEEDYYGGYSESLFAVTFKRGGWDCMRHYEIVAAGALPYFADFAHCPDTIMTTWPRDLQMSANGLSLHYISGRSDESRYRDLLSEFRRYGLANLTTKSLAMHVLSSVGITK